MERMKIIVMSNSLWRKEGLIPGRRVKLFQNLQAFQLEGIVEVSKEEIGEKLVKLFHLFS